MQTTLVLKCGAVFTKAWVSVAVRRHRANEEICPPLRSDIPAAAIRNLSRGAPSQTFMESGPLQIFISCSVFIN